MTIEFDQRGTMYPWTVTLDPGALLRRRPG
ncbi:UNVERIFIED_ORG: hypothetical protein FHR35_003756 [Microbispora rosea subsp. rosea]